MEGEAGITHYLITITLSNSEFDEWSVSEQFLLQAVNVNGSWVSGEKDEKQCIHNNHQ